MGTPISFEVGVFLRHDRSVRAVLLLFHHPNRCCEASLGYDGREVSLKMPIRQKTLFEIDGLCVRLSHYGANESMPAHGHEYHQVSWLLAGEIAECISRCDREVLQPARGVKPAGCMHANVYGQQGSLILSANLDCDAVRQFLPGNTLDWGWGESEDGNANVHALMNVIATGGELARDAVADLLASSGRISQTGHREVPAWLTRVREQLRDDEFAPDLESLAAGAGVHRVHLSRSFVRHFGVPPSVYRARSRAAQGLSRLVNGEEPALAALDAGFADQSHFSRWVKKMTGLPPKRLQRLMAA